MQACATVLDEEWALLTEFLPADWRELAVEERAIRHQKGITDPAMVLRLILLHVAGGLSLRQAAARAKELGWASISDVALLKRLRSSERWLRALTSRMYGASRFGQRRARINTLRRLRAVDATTVEEPGATGTDWRVHYSVNLSDMTCDFYEVTDERGGETYRRFPVAPGDIILGDRGYSHRQGVAHVVSAKGDVVVRLNWTSFPLLALTGKSFDILAHLRQMEGHVAHQWDVQFEVDDQRYRARLCALRKSHAAAQNAKERIRRTAVRKQKNIHPDTLEFAEYVFVLTTLDSRQFSAADVLELYRARWQIELVFKRLKSLLRLGHVPKYNDQSARAWIEAKLLTVLLIEALQDKAHFFSPWGYKLSAPQSLA